MFKVYYLSCVRLINGFILVLGHQLLFVALKLGLNNLFTFLDFDTFLSPQLPRPTPGGGYLPGTVTFVSSILAPTRTDLCEAVEAISSVLNICCCLIQCESQNVAVFSVYRSPSTCTRILLSDLEAIFTILSHAVNSLNYYDCMHGDLNVDLFSNAEYSSSYFYLLADFYLSQHVMGASCVTETSSTLVDHIISI